MVSSLKNIVTGSMTGQSTKPKKKASHLSNSHYATNINLAQTVASDSAKQIQ